MRPTACPRCARASDTWTFERDQGLAGCPCGEVIPYVFDDTPLEELSTTPKKPRMWVEDARANGFVATLKPSVRFVGYALALTLGLLLIGSRAMLGAAAIGWPVGVVLAAVALAVAFGWSAYQSGRQWTFAFEGGRFRADARGHHTEVPLEDVQRFSVAAVSPKTKGKAADARASFELVVSRTNGERVRVPLFVEGPHEAQFIADRANALLATDGRTIDGDYRGQHVRVAEDVAPVRVEDVDRTEEVDDRDEAEDRRPRMQRRD